MLNKDEGEHKISKPKKIPATSPTPMKEQIKNQKKKKPRRQIIMLEPRIGKGGHPSKRL